MKRKRFFTPREVASHNTEADLWVSFLGRVCDLTPLMEEHKGDVLLLPILEFAGRDISRWFDPDTNDVLRYVDPLTNCVRFFTPRGRFLHVPPAGPRSDWASLSGAPWWRDERYVVGNLTRKTRWIRIVNTLTSQEQRLQVCSEETLQEVQLRYLEVNAHAGSYTWTHSGGAALDMSRTLEENQVQDEDLEDLRMTSDLCPPAVLLLYNDDLTEG
ncbi:hypothetical protein CesoFtcFv8_015707 [Champsocephalus esox]|uniref:Cytochrome b5 domain-containing protein 1 n=1 Tax=Champsocephalus esox TaxID=159716 RepID=A0AAN8GT56_9TELE|nr:hypothetical protein CesoFtcFv8_015707 [Champsocephalus esox]